MEKTEKKKESWKERKTKIKKRWHVPFIYVEWKCEQLSEILKRWAFLDILGQVGHLSILVAVIFYFVETGERRVQAEHQQRLRYYQAWQVINAARGTVGNGGRVKAVEDLVKDKASLEGLDMSVTYSPKINLKGGQLRFSNFSKSNLVGANLYEADLSITNLSEANLSEADLSRANLFSANLSEANLPEANLYRANLKRTNLSGANLYRANLKRTNLSGAELMDISNWQNIQSIEYANLYDVQNPPDGFIVWAKQQGAVSIEDDVEWKKLIRQKK
jgi:hypothetical protein